MIAIKINDVKNFIQKLLLDNTFDLFLVGDIEINSYTNFSISGRLNSDFIINSKDDLNEEFIYWRDIKPTINAILKNEKAPSKIKLIFSIPHHKYNDLCTSLNIGLSPNDIGGLYLNVTFENNAVSIITGATINTFTMDKSLDQCWDKYCQHFLSKNFDISIL